MLSHMRQEMVGDFAAPNIIYMNNNDDDLENSLFLFLLQTLTLAQAYYTHTHLQTQMHVLRAVSPIGDTPSARIFLMCL